MPVSLLNHRSVTARACWEGLEFAAAPAAVLDALAAQPFPAMLESAAEDPRYGRYTVIACRPREIITLRKGRLLDRTGAELPGRTVRRALRSALGTVRARGTAPVPYGPGWIGYIGYEFGRHLERLPGRAERDTSLPDLHLAFYDATAVYDNIEKRWTLTWLAFDEPNLKRRESAEMLRKMLESAREETQVPKTCANPQTEWDKALKVSSNFSPEEYRRTIARCIEYIAAGDIFQVNLSQRFTVADAPGPPAIYKALRRRNPAWYSAMLLFDDSAVISSSPELFLRVRGRDVLTRPIKGTCRRTGRREDDAAAAAELLASEKDNAELAMIIDLLRNDLGRVCRYGSVRVSNRRELETHPTVFHLVGSVVGELCERFGPVDLLAATFPGGSITGAPKIRAMEIIDELEPVARGVYTGSIGHIGADGNCELNIAIRTIVWDRGKAHIQVGGGIVADSTPEGEYTETLDKARAVLEAIAEAQRQ
ncbi:MAG: aminodeoxychorismate synthase component I [Planctomycetota bacterium]|nr:aminodeoxychorismate synthase component I [Planctomycetota bacterium]